MGDIVYREFAGINNKQPAYRLADDELTVALNVDIDDSKQLSRRDGSASVYAGNCHSLFADGDICLFRAANALYRLFPNYTAKLLHSSLSGRTVYHAQPGRIYFSDGQFAGWTDGEQAFKWGIEPPSAQPLAAALVDGRLPSGRYQYAVTFLRADGVESGTPLPRVLDAAQGIQFTQIPVSSDAQVTHKAIYLSRPNGETLYRALRVGNATTSATYTGNCSDYGVALETFNKIAAPGCTHISEFNGRLLLAVDRFLLYSAPYQHEYFKWMWSYAFATPVTLIAPVSDGVFVGDSEGVYFLSGNDIANAGFNHKAGYGALDQTACYADGADVLRGYSGRVAVFVTSEGVCVGADGGGFVNLTNARYALPASVQAASVVRSIKGFKQFLSILK